MYPMLWVVLGSVALAVGTTMTLMPILEDNIAPRTVEVMGLFLGIGGIAIGLVIASLQMRQSKRMDRIISGTRQRENRRKMYYLQRIHSTTSTIKDNLESLQGTINKYANDRKPDTWQIARNKAKRSKEQTQELGKWIRDDFSKVIDLVESPRLLDKFEVENIYFTEWVLIDALKTNPEYDEDLVQLRNDIREQIQKLNNALSLLEKEMPKDEL
jgi:hypothetical protein